MQAIGLGEIGVAFVHDQNGHFLRLLTDGDIRRALLEGHGLQASIEVIPEKKVVVANAKHTFAEISGFFNEKIRVIPVLDENNTVIDFHLYDKRTHISVAKPWINEHELELVSECIITGWVSSAGRFVTEFERLVAEYAGCNYGIACSSGTTALHLALIACGIGRGDEVIVPSLSFIATANAVAYTGASPVFVDSDMQTWNIDVNKIEESITSKTKAIVPVHLFGHPANMDAITEIAKKHNLLVVEDAAEAQGATVNEKQVGSIGNCGIFSFFGNKIITTGEGGMVVTNDEDIAERCRLYRDHGMSKDKRYWHEVLGFNYRMTNLQAALGVAQMHKIRTIIERKKEIADLYDKLLVNSNKLILPKAMSWAEHVYWLYTIIINPSKANISVTELTHALQEKNIETRPVFPPMHTQPIYNHKKSLPNAEYISKHGLSLPSSPELKDEQVEEICSVLLDCLA